jgi:predicted DNA-binding ribbon-helix-helix protein
LVPLRKAIAAEILGTVDETGIWGELLSCDDPRIRLDCLKYLTDRRDGKIPQSAQSENPRLQFVVRSILDIA